MPYQDATHSLTLLRDSVERLLDSERLLPADGQALLEMVRRAGEHITLGDTHAAAGVLQGCETLLVALAESGVLDSASTDRCVAHIRLATERLAV